MKHEELPESPRLTANILSKLSFWWLFKLFREGKKRDLETEDLYRVLPDDRSENLGNLLAEAWKEEIRKCKIINGRITDNSNKGRNRIRQPSLTWAILKVFGFDYALLGIWAFIDECVLKIIQPLCLGLLIRYFGGEFRNGFLGGYEGYLFATGIFVSSFYYTFQHHPFFFAVLHNGMRMRIACSSLIYRKSLKLSQASIGQTTIGQLVNFLSNDVSRFDQCTIFFHYLWIGPVQLGIVIFILWGYFGPSCLSGIALLVLFVPFQSWMGKMFSSLRLKTAVRTDRRIRYMNEIVSAIRVIKMYTWEKPFSLLVGDARKDEISVIRKSAFLRSVNLSFYYIASKVIIFLTLLAYVLTGNYINSEKVFVTLSLYNNVRLIMTLFFPNGIAHLAEVMVSIKRIQTFLLMEERQNDPNWIQISKQLNDFPTTSKNNTQQTSTEVNSYVKVRNFSARWNKNADEMTLSNINFEVKAGELLAIIGTVGASKGSLLQAILRELPPTYGEIFVCGRLAYTAQEPWVFGGSVRDNILFGRPYDHDWYLKVLEACALKRDLSLFPFGDKTIVGDRGASLSGGQKARVNLARAVYANADIYLLDDPLSAVDSEVGRHLFENCILGILKEKTVILVTHQLQFLKPASQIILLNGGRVEVQGNYTELLGSGINFTQMMLNESAASPTVVPVSGPGLKSRTSSEISILAKTEFRRSSSMSQLEMGLFGDLQLPQDFEGELDDRSLSISIAKSLQTPNQRCNRRSSSAKGKGLLFIQSLKKEIPIYGTFTSRKSSLDQEEKPIVPEELIGTGNINLSLYWKYIRAGSNCFTLVLLLISNISTQVLFTGSDYFLQYWTRIEESRTPNISIVTNDADYYNDDYNPLGIDENRIQQVWIYSGIIGTLFIISLLRTVGFFEMCMRASTNLHRNLFYGVLRAPMLFFEVNPVGRILNRFAKDIGIVDELLPPTLFDTFEVALQVIGIVTIVSIVNPYLLIPSVSLAFIFYYIRRFYLYTARSIKRLEGIARSPVFSHLSTSLYGLTTIRAFRCEEEFVKQFDDFQDFHSSAWYLFLATARWLGIFVDYVSVMYIAIVAYSFLLYDQGGLGAGLAISSSLSLTGLFQWGVRQSAECENQMVSVERIIDYSNLESEADLDSQPGKKPPKEWPSKGGIKFEGVSLKYGDGEDDPAVLKSINFVIKPKEKIGIVGRTGSGKSSLIAAIFRIAEPYEGIIQIDGINVLKIGLQDLRSKISIIPQDPVLFSGSLRRNLDPFEEYTDLDIWKVLEEVYLARYIRELSFGLDTEIAEGGSNFSVGQRQLICLGRAILRKNKILILDEATANVDPETDVLIQKTIRDKFEECTVLTVAHRLHTVMDSDRIMVLDAGTLKEFDAPYILLCDSKSSLNQFSQQTGKQTALYLMQIAKTAFEHRRNQSMENVAEIYESATEEESYTCANDHDHDQDQDDQSQEQSQDEDSAQNSINYTK